MRPAVDGKSPVIALNNVVFPAPFAPRMPRRSPAPTVKSTLSRATSAPKVRLTPSRTRAWAAPARFSLSASAMDLCAPLLPLDHGQLGLSRPTGPIAMNSASGMPSVWFTFSTTFTTLL